MSTSGFVRRLAAGCLTALALAAAPVFAAEDAAGAASDAAAKAESEEVMKAPEAAPERPLLSLDGAELAVLSRLAERRRELEAREAALREREILTRALEEKLSRQAKELQELKAALMEQERKLTAMKQADNSEEQARLQDLAKAYKTMKPRDAARLFDELDLTLVTSIARELSPRVLAPVMAKMSPDKARALTRALREG